MIFLKVEWKLQMTSERSAKDYKFFIVMWEHSVVWKCIRDAMMNVYLFVIDHIMNLNFQLWVAKYALGAAEH